MSESNSLHFANGYLSNTEKSNKRRKARHRKTAAERLGEALLAMPAPPCTKHGRCPHYKHCAATGEACEAFMLYAAQVDGDNAPRVPKRKLGKRLWNRVEIFAQSIESLLTNAK